MNLVDDIFVIRTFLQMSCSTCSSHVLRGFLYAFDLQPNQLLQRHIVRTVRRRSLYTSPILRIDATPTRSLGHGAVDANSSNSFDNVYLPFDSPMNLRAIPQIIPFQYCSGASKSFHSSKSNDVDPQHSDRPSSSESSGDAKDVTYRSNIKVRGRPRPHRLIDNGASTSIPTKYGVSDRIRHNKTSKQATSGRRPRSFPTIGSKTFRSSRIVSERGYQTATEDQKVFAPREPWQVQKKALGEKFGETGWQPRKRLSPDALDGIRALHSQYPEDYSTSKLADQFKVSPEAIRRILKSKWRPSEVEDASRRDRWQKRGEAIWSQMVELGVKPPKKWREMGVGKSSELYTKRSKLRTKAGHSGNSLVAFDGVAEVTEAGSQEGRSYMSCALSDRIL